MQEAIADGLLIITINELEFLLKLFAVCIFQRTLKEVRSSPRVFIRPPIISLLTETTVIQLKQRFQPTRYDWQNL